MILRMENVTKRFKGLVAVDHLNMEIRKGQINALIGPNGSGKTTTLNMISGFLLATEGEIYYSEEQTRITDLPEYKIARLGIRRTFQNIKMYYSMTALENVMMGGQGQDSSILKFILDRRAAVRFEKELRDRAYQALDFVGLAAERDRLTKDLPYGQQKKIEIARALIAHPKLILLDEPATGLNPTERAELVGIIERICSEGVSVLLIEHNMDVIMKISSWITVLNFGKKIAEGTASDIQNNDLVIEAYLGSRYKKNRGVREC